jgi:hypothetical protein
MTGGAPPHMGRRSRIMSSPFLQQIRTAAGLTEAGVESGRKALSTMGLVLRVRSVGRFRQR